MKTATYNDFIPELLVNESFSVYHAQSPRKVTPCFHSHDFYELYFFISGDASAYVEELTYPLRQHDVTIFPPGKMHRAFFHNPDTHYERMVVYVSGEMLASMAQCGFDPKKALDDHIAKNELHRAFSAEQFEHCANLVHEIVALSADQSCCTQALRRCKFITLITLFCKYFDESAEKPSIDNAGRMAAVIAYINEHISEPLSLEGIANRFFINKYHLSREFKNYTNRTVYQYILSKRIILAKQLLNQGVQPTCAFNRCGFSDYSSFYKVFKREVGQSPQRYLAELPKGY